MGYYYPQYTTQTEILQLQTTTQAIPMKEEEEI